MSSHSTTQNDGYRKIKRRIIRGWVWGTWLIDRGRDSFLLVTCLLIVQHGMKVTGKRNDESFVDECRGRDSLIWDMTPWYGGHDSFTWDMTHWYGEWGDMNESCPPIQNELVLPPIWINHIPSMNESCPTCTQVMSPIWTSHVPPYKQVMSPISMCRVPNFKASCAPYEYECRRWWRICCTAATTRHCSNFSGKNSQKSAHSQRCHKKLL